ncbi:arginase family protein [Nonomuraea spiralis]|uniref:arginase family protein n=1 Tax=Nonomuraea TaxID=83681 RepID=UPI000F7902B0|nr:arginase family protein [Nonomuraea sp. WAC 01424]RSN14508.1 arginase [Nonomuraea sp. WAC 01424]
MSVLYVPYHLDEHQPDLNVPLPGGVPVAEFAVELPGPDVWSRLGQLYDAVAATVERTVRAGTLPVVVSGDCTVSIGMTAGLQRAGLDPSIVWIDAHGDLQTLETTPSGYLGGMALRFLLGYRPDHVADRLALRPPAEERVLLVDARDLDPPEADYLASSGVSRSGLDALTPETLPPGPILLNLDLDVLDPSCLPGLRYPAADGPGVAALLRAARVVLDSGRLAALNLACTWHPGRADPDGTREHLVTTILADLRAQQA